MGKKGKKPVKDVRGYAFAANIKGKDGNTGSAQPATSEASATKQPTPSVSPTQIISTEPETPTIDASSKTKETAETKNNTTTNTHTNTTPPVEPSPLPQPAWDDEPEESDTKDDVIDVEFVRAARAQRAARAHEDDATKADIDKLPYLALDDSTEHDVLEVLRDMGALNLVDTSEKTFAQRTLKKLNTIYTIAVEDLGFHEKDVENAMRVTGGFPLSVVLDWLCINVPIENMPPGFADKMYFSKQSQIEISIAKAKAEGPSIDTKAKDKEEKENIEQEKALAKEREEKEKEKEREKGNMKSWIVQYTQDESESEEEEEDDLEAELFGRKPGKIDLKQKIEQGRKAKQETRQAKQEKEGEKATKQSEVKKSDQEVPEIEGGDILGMFDEDAAQAAQTTTLPKEEGPKVAFVEMTIPKSWSGKTPKTSLLEWNRNKFKGTNVKIRGTGLKFNVSKKGGGFWCEVTNKGSGVKSADEWEVIMPDDEVCATQEEAENYVSTIALYKFAASLGVHRVLPPVFRSLWIQWENDAKQEYSNAQRKKDENRVIFLKEVMQVQASQINFSPHLAVPNAPLPLQKSEHPTTIRGDTKQGTNAEGKKFQQLFETRRNSSEYAKYLAQRQNLPIFEKREEILQLLDENQVLIISGETGSGKSTQVPQFIVEEWLKTGKGEKCNVVCTEPRRISAISLATRVSLEMGDGEKKIGTVGSLCGYQIRLESKLSSTTRLTYCTTGIALRRLEDSSNFEGVSHVIVDEVHERTLESDFLLVILKKLLAVNPNLRVVLMSATINAEQFSAYFHNCPVINVSGRTFPVHPFFLEDSIEMTNYILEEDSEFAIRKQRDRNVGKVNVSAQRGNTQTVTYDINDIFADDDAVGEMLNTTGIDPTAFSKSTLLSLSRYDEAKVNFELIELLLRQICFETPSEEEEDPMTAAAQGAILIFLPGIQEIRSLFDHLTAQRDFGDANKFWVFPLHSSLTSEQQVRVFDVPEKESGIRKIVLSTNIAETGITIPDCTVVIDSGRVKEMSYDERKSMSILKDVFISKANAMQRRGRAGRVQSGVCFHLFTHNRFEHMPANQLPEILRLPLEELCLKIKIYGFGKIADFLGSALSPPSALSINNAVENLAKVQALDKDEQLTPLGSHLASLPVDVHVGKMILFGSIFRCLDPIITIAACISFKSPFVRPFGKEDEADKARDTFKTAGSDFLSLYSAYSSWREKIVNNRNSNAAKEFCRKFYCSFMNFCMIEDMKRQLLELLVSIGFVSQSEFFAEKDKQRSQNSSIQMCPVISSYNTNSSSLPILNAVLTAGLYPKVLLNTSLSFSSLFPSPTPAHTLTNLSTKTIVHVHPASINFNEDLRALWFVYHTMVKSTKVFVWDCNAVSAYPIFLFSGDIDVTHASKLVVIDKTIKLKCYAKTAVIFKRLRDELNAILKMRINDPGLHKEKSSQQQTKVISLITNLLESEYDREKRNFVPIVK